MRKDWDTQEQCDLFDEFLKDTSDSRSHSFMTGAHGYDELEWEAFQYGWNAAKEHFGVTQ
jgi:hypothetical protein